MRYSDHDHKGRDVEKRSHGYGISREGDSFSILNVVADFSHRYISSSLRPRKNTSSVCSPSPSEDCMNSDRPGDLDGPVLCFLRGWLTFLASMGSARGPDGALLSNGVPIFQT